MMDSIKKGGQTLINLNKQGLEESKDRLQLSISHPRTRAEEIIVEKVDRKCFKVKLRHTKEKVWLKKRYTTPKMLKCKWTGTSLFHLKQILYK